MKIEIELGTKLHKKELEVGKVYFLSDVSRHAVSGMDNSLKSMSLLEIVMFEKSIENIHNMILCEIEKKSLGIK
jgi:hypothetical protein